MVVIFLDKDNSVAAARRDPLKLSGGRDGAQGRISSERLIIRNRLVFTAAALLVVLCKEGKAMS